MRAFTLLMLAVASGCSFEIPEKRFRCDAAHTCPPGQECVEGLCEIPGDEQQGCVPLEPPDNGHIVESSVEVGGSVVFACDEGFVLVGEDTRTCTVDLTWSGAAPSCADSCPGSAPACDLGADIMPATGCLEGSDDNLELNYGVTEIVIPLTSDEKGFDLDCFHTTEDDAYGCYRPDDGDGIDNVFAGLNSAWRALDVDLNDLLARAIGIDGDIRIRFVIREHDGASNDDCVVVELEMFDPDIGDFAPTIDPLEGVVQGGVLKFVADTLPLVFPLENDHGELVLVPVDISRARVEFPIYGIGERGIIGGHILMEDESERDLKTLNAAVAASSDTVLDPDHLDGIVTNMLDMAAEGVSAHPCDCRAMSAGIEIVALPE